MQAVLVMFRSDGERRSFSVTRDMTVIGRREDCDLRIPLGEISRKHCRLVRDGDIFKIEDLGSSNGTYLNARRVQEALLSPGDSIQVGPVVFVLQIDGEPDDDELSPVTMAAPAADAEDSDVDMMMANDDSGVLENAGAAEGGVEEMEALEEIGDPGEIGSDTAQPAAAQADELEPLEELDPLEPDLDLGDDSEGSNPNDRRQKLEG